jgi:hypothetical protein
MLKTAPRSLGGGGIARYQSSLCITGCAIEEDSEYSVLIKLIVLISCSMLDSRILEFWHPNRTIPLNWHKNIHPKVANGSCKHCAVQMPHHTSLTFCKIPDTPSNGRHVPRYVHMVVQAQRCAPAPSKACFPRLISPARTIAASAFSIDLSAHELSKVFESIRTTQPIFRGGAI